MIWCLSRSSGNSANRSCYVATLKWEKNRQNLISPKIQCHGDDLGLDVRGEGVMRILGLGVRDEVPRVCCVRIEKDKW